MVTFERVREFHKHRVSSKWVMEQIISLGGHGAVDISKPLMVRLCILTNRAIIH